MGQGGEPGGDAADPKPLVDVAIEAGDWPAEAELQVLCERAVEATVAALSAAASARPAGDPPAGARVRQADAELSLRFTDDAAMRRLNAAWRGKDRATNVLSFPQASGPLLGDIVLGYETVRDEAALAGTSLQAHMAHLIIHGFLHLLGYDHEEETEAEAMEVMESAALARMGIADPYAAARAQ